MRRFVFLVLIVLGVVAAGTYVAGEQTEVAVLRTVGETGESYETKLWVVDYDGAPWVRVARADRHWYERLLHEPHAQLVRGDVTQDVVATPEDSSEMHAALDAAFRAKYGAVDWWYGLLLRRDPIPVRLDPVERQY